MNIKAIWEKVEPECKICRGEGEIYHCKCKLKETRGCEFCGDMDSYICPTCKASGIQPFESWLSDKLEEAIDLLDDVNWCINEGETIKCFRELCQFLDQFKGE